MLLLEALPREQRPRPEASEGGSGICIRCTWMTPLGGVPAIFHQQKTPDMLGLLYHSLVQECLRIHPEVLETASKEKEVWM